MSDIAAMVDALIAGGTPPSLAAQIVAEAFIAGVQAAPSRERSSSAVRMKKYRDRRAELGLEPVFDAAKYRKKIAERDGKQCAYCLATDRPLDVDHMVPIVQGGTDDLDNLAFACRPCNGRKSGRTPKEAGMELANKSAHSAHVRFVRSNVRLSNPSPPKEVSPYNPLQEITPPSLPPSAAAPSRALADPEKDLFDRGKQVLGKSAGGMIAQLLRAKDGKINLARAAIETSAGKENPREWIGRIIRGHDPPSGEASTYVDGRL